MAAKLGRLVQTRTAFFLCDIQEKFRPTIHNFPAVVDVAQRMVAASGILGIPLIATEQYPKGLGKLVPELGVPESLVVVPKTSFTMMVPEVRAQLQALPTDRQPQSVVLFGIEAHACIQATALDLIAEGIDVHILVDGVSSRSPLDRRTALERLRGAGAFLTTTESVLLELMRGSHHANFKEVQKLIMKQTPSDIWE